MRDLWKGKHNYHEALMIIHSASGKEVARIGHCPFFKFGCPFTTDREGKAIVPETVSVEYVSSKCPSFQGGCPYDVKELKGLAKDCPAFENGGCPFKNVKTIGDMKSKMGEMRDSHVKSKVGKANQQKALDLAHAANGHKVFQLGHCPFFKDGCFMKTDLNGRLVSPGSITMDYAKMHCPSFDKGKRCPYKAIDFKGLGRGCPEFKDGCPFKNVKDINEFQAKVGEMRDKHKRNPKAQENSCKAKDLIHKANSEEVAKIGQCSFNMGHCEFKTDSQGKPIM